MKSSRKFANGSIQNSSPEKRKKKTAANKIQTNVNNKNTECTVKNLPLQDDSSCYDDLDEYYSEDDPSRPDGLLELKISNISKYKEGDFRAETKILSQEATIIRCLPWKILFMLHQERSQRCMGFFLQCNAKSDSTVWHCHAKAELRLVAQRRMSATNTTSSISGGSSILTGASANTTSIGNGASNMTSGSTNNLSYQDLVKPIEHNFFYRENDWGFSNFISWPELMNPERGFVGNDDSILLQVHVNQADAPHGVDWDSKKHTGFLGLKNQGATCYMNSLLQALYFTNKLRKAVFQLPTDTDDEQRSVSLALQRVFYELQFGERAVGTKRLTKSFGWETLDTFMQHDAQELCRVLLDNLECKMKGTRVEQTIPSLFCGRMMSFVRCKNVPVESRREEAFYDIQLKVKGNNDIYKAFDEYITMETLDGDNKYDAGECGLQEAEKGIVFVKLPPVLYLQLMRFQYDYEADANIKINDRFEFPYSLDLTNYVHNAAITSSSSSSSSPTVAADSAALLDRTTNERCKYVLHTVLVHSGDNHGGHYVAYLNPYGRNEWYKFDDDVVSRCSRRDAILANYGSNEDESSTNSTMKQCTNAYMLVYMCEADLNDLLCPIEYSDIPINLHQRFANEKHVEGQKRIEKANAHLYYTAIILLDEDFYGWQGYELFDVERNNYWRRLRIPRKFSSAETTQLAAEFLRDKPERTRLWCIISKNNQIQLSPLESRESQMALANHNDLNSSNSSGTTGSPMMLWVQTLPADQPQISLTSLPNLSNTSSISTAPSSPLLSSNQSWCLVFTKFYDSRTQSIHYTGWLTVPLSVSLKEALFPVLCERAHLPPNTQLTIWEERERKILSKISQQKLSDPIQLPYHGLIIVYEIAGPSQLMVSVPSSLQVPQMNAGEFLDDLVQRVNLEFIEKIGELTQRDADNKPLPVRIVVRLSLKSRYMDLVKSLAENLQRTMKLSGAGTADLNKIQLYRAILSNVCSNNRTGGVGVDNSVQSANQTVLSPSSGNNMNGGGTGVGGTGGTANNNLVPGEAVRTTFDGTLADLLLQSGQASPPTTVSHIHSTLPRTQQQQQQQQLHHSHNPTTRLLTPPLVITSSTTNSASPAQHNQTQHYNTTNINFGIKRIFFQLLKIPITEMETMLQLPCRLFFLNQLVDLTVSVPRNSTGQDLLIEAVRLATTLSSTSASFPTLSISKSTKNNTAKTNDTPNVTSQTSSLTQIKPTVVDFQNIKYNNEGDDINASQKYYRLFEILDHRIICQITANKRLTEIEPNRVILIEPAYNDLGSEAMLIAVAHGQLELPLNRVLFGQPFTVLILNGEPVENLRQRIRNRLIQDQNPTTNIKEFDKWGIAVMNGSFPVISNNNNTNGIITHLYGGDPDSSGFSTVDSINFDLFTNQHQQQNDATTNHELSSSLVSQSGSSHCHNLFINYGRPWICLDHKMPNIKRPRPLASEKPIKIHN